MVFNNKVKVYAQLIGSLCIGFYTFGGVLMFINSNIIKKDIVIHEDTSFNPTEIDIIPESVVDTEIVIDEIEVEVAEITLPEPEIKEKEVEIEETEEIVKRPKFTKIDSSFNVNSISGLTVEEINKILEPTEMRGLGQFIFDCEQTYKVNARFIIAVAGTETTYGKHGLGKSKNAIFSIRIPGKSGYQGFATKEESIDHFCRVIANGQYYFKKNRFTIKQIGLRYAESYTKWINSTISIINQNVD